MKFPEGGLPEFFSPKIRSEFFSESPVENFSCRARPENFRAGPARTCKSSGVERLSHDGGATINDPGVVSANRCGGRGCAQALTGVDF